LAPTSPARCLHEPQRVVLTQTSHDLRANWHTAHQSHRIYAGIRLP
jgi:hypothetical protein